MAEAFGTFSAVISVLDIGVRTSTKLSQLINEWKFAPNLLLALSNEVSDLDVVLDRIKESQNTIQTSNILQNAELLTQLNTQLQRAKHTLTELEKSINDFDRLSTLRKRNKWLLKKSKAESLQKDLRIRRRQINDLLLVYNV